MRWNGMGKVSCMYLFLLSLCCRFVAVCHGLLWLCDCEGLTLRNCCVDGLCRFFTGLQGSSPNLRRIFADSSPGLHGFSLVLPVSSHLHNAGMQVCRYILGPSIHMHPYPPYLSATATAGIQLKIFKAASRRITHCRSFKSKSIYIGELSCSGSGSGSGNLNTEWRKGGYLGTYYYSYVWR